MRFAIIILAMAAFVGTSVAQSGCAHPYSGKPERLSKPKKKSRPEPTEEEAAAGPVLDDKCKADFFGDPTTKRKTSQANGLTQQAEEILSEAEGREGPALISAVTDALSKLRNSLKADPYLPEATYKMAVAYALVGKKGCSLMLLQRLQDLTKMPEVSDKADRIINKALRDQTFDLFRKDADAAMGR